MNSLMKPFHPLPLSNVNPLSPDTDQICEQIYKKLTDSSGAIQDRFIKICEIVDIDPRELLLK
jgi:hypothetical protein